MEPWSSGKLSFTPGRRFTALAEKKVAGRTEYRTSAVQSPDSTIALMSVFITGELKGKDAAVDCDDVPNAISRVKPRNGRTAHSLEATGNNG